MRLLVGRPKEGICLRAQRLGLGIDERWTSHEDDIVRRHYADAQWDKMLALLPNRTINGLKARARALGLRTKRSVVRAMRVEQHRKQGHQIWPSYGRINGSFLAARYHAAESRDLECPLLDGSEDSMRYLDAIAYDCCALSGLPLIYAIKSRDTNATASLDRIDSSKGYVKGNVQWVHKTINGMKWDSNEKDFITFCCAVARHRGGVTLDNVS